MLASLDIKSLRLEDRFWCFISGHHWHNINSLPRFVFKDKMVLKEYDLPRYLCLGCGTEKR